MITSVLNEKVVNISECKGIYPFKQKGGIKESYGCKHQPSYTR